jgi:hypothetical protein
VDGALQSLKDYCRRDGGELLKTASVIDFLECRLECRFTVDSALQYDAALARCHSSQTIPAVTMMTGLLVGVQCTLLWTVHCNTTQRSLAAIALKDC